jgi:hypothetical protein
MTMLDRRSNRKRERQAAYRQRRARGVVIWRVEVTAARYGTLVELGYLAAGETDPAASARAVEALIDQILDG